MVVAVAFLSEAIAHANARSRAMGRSARRWWREKHARWQWKVLVIVINSNGNIVIVISNQ